MSGMLECRALCKRYGNTTALAGITAEFAPGRIVGLLGPNGSGKTTLLKLAAGLLTPTSGQVLVCGQAPGPATKSLVSYLPERTYLPAGMRVRDTAAMFADFYADFDAPKAAAMLADLGVEPDAKLSQLSKGAREKVQLVLVMSRAARLYLLDEPLGGVDPAARDYILSTIVRNYAEDAALVLSTHLIGDIERILDDAVVLNTGALVRADSVDNIRQEQGVSVDAWFREVFRCSQNC